MASFRQFLNENIFSNVWSRMATWLNSWWTRIRNAILSSARPDPQSQSITFTFPGDVYLTEAAGYDKGLRIMQNIDTSSWTGPQQKSFAAQVKKNIRNISSTLGLRMELDIVIYLYRKYKLKLTGADINVLVSQESEYTSRIKEYLRNEFVFHQFDDYVRQHAIEIAEAIYSRTRELIRCNPVAMFYEIKTIGQKSDLKLLCNDRNTAWSLKYVSEQLVSVRTMAVANAYQVLGGKDKSRDTSYYRFISKTSDPKETKEIALDDLWDAIQSSNWTNDPGNFTRLLTLLLKGDDNALMAIKNYTVNRGAVGEPSSEMSRNFDIQVRPNGLIFRPKSDATITARKTKEYIKLSYVVGASKNPTFINIEMNTKNEDDGVRAQFKINNLVG